MNVTPRISAFCLLLLSIIWNSPAHSQLTKINVGYRAISGDALPAWVAKDAGIFEKNGLDVELVFFTGGTTAVMALVSADTPIAQLAGPAVVNSVIAGSDSTLLAGGVTSLNYYLLSRSEIKKSAYTRKSSPAASSHGSPRVWRRACKKPGPSGSCANCARGRRYREKRSDWTGPGIVGSRSRGCQASARPASRGPDAA